MKIRNIQMLLKEEVALQKFAHFVERKAKAVAEVEKIHSCGRKWI